MKFKQKNLFTSLLLSSVSLLSCTQKLDSKTFVDMDSVRIDSKDAISEAMVNYELDYHYQNPGQNYSIELLWRGYDSDRWNGCYGSKTRRLSTYLNYYGEDEDGIYLLYLKTADIPEYQEFLKKKHVNKDDYRDDYAILFYDEDDTLKIDGKYLYAYQKDDDKNDYAVVKANDISEIKMAIDDYTLVFAAKRKPVEIKEDVSAGVSYTNNVIYAYHQLRLEFSNANVAPSLLGDSAAYGMSMSSHTGEILEAFHPSSIVSNGIYAPNLGMAEASTTYIDFGLDFKILTVGSKKCISLPHYENYGKEKQWDLLDSSLEISEYSDVYFDAKDDFKDALVQDLYEGGKSGYGLFDYDKVTKIIQKYHSI